VNIVIVHLVQERDADWNVGAVRLHPSGVGEQFSCHFRTDSLHHVPEAETGSSDPQSTIPLLLKFLDGFTIAVLDMTTFSNLVHICDEFGYDLPGGNDPLDISLLSRILMPTVKDTHLPDVAANLGVPVVLHTAPDIACTAAHVLDQLHQRSLELPYVTLQQLTGLAGAFSAHMSAWFNAASEARFNQSGAALATHSDSIHQLVFSAQPQIEESKDEEVVEELDDAVHFLKTGSPLQSILPGFEVRAGQLQMVESVDEALRGDQHLMVEAGTGTGKSLAYLIPAALYAIQNDTRVVVSTHTIALQDQIQTRDFPMLKSVIPHPVSLTVFKGRTHYVCLRKVLQEVRSAGIASPREDLEAYMKLLVWLVTTPAGTREELPLQGKLSDVWVRVQSETETCINKRCPFFKPCYYFRARSKAYDADVVVTNHSLVFSDLKANHRVLPKYDKLILDEAHHLEEQATKHLGDEAHLFQCLALIGRLSRDNARHGVVPELLTRLNGSDSRSVIAIPALENMVDTLKMLRSCIDSAFATLAQLVPGGQSDFRLTHEVESSKLWTTYLDVCEQMVAHVKILEAFSATITEAAEFESDEDLAGRMFDTSGFLLELFGHIHILATAGDISEHWVVWIEANGPDKRQISLHRAPVDVAQILKDTLFDTKSTVVLTSATLSVDGKFEYPISRLGLHESKLDGRLATLTVSSPFQLDRQALLCVPNDVPELAKMTAEEAATWLSDSIYQLAKVSQGRLLALFTSHAMLRATASSLRTPLHSIGLSLYAQGIDGSRTHLLESFRKHPNSVLLGAQSFWEGIDLPGDQLTTLVIVRLPFSPPTHPVTQARHERLEEQGLSSFAHASLPEAVVRFRQGFGRLIRTVRDRGVVVVYDKRIVTARYGSSFIRSLGGVKPFVAKEQEVMSRVKAFLASSP
jgi:ATP-dependent DNA helicase DinG